MPDYEYKCKAGHEFEITMPATEYKDSVEKCPECGTDSERDFRSAPGFTMDGNISPNKPGTRRK